MKGKGVGVSKAIPEDVDLEIASYIVNDPSHEKEKFSQNKFWPRHVKTIKPQTSIQNIYGTNKSNTSITRSSLSSIIKSADSSHLTSAYCV